jgi:hypothetical protein
VKYLGHVTLFVDVKSSRLQCIGHVDSMGDKKCALNFENSDLEEREADGSWLVIVSSGGHWHQRFSTFGCVCSRRA